VRRRRSRSGRRVAGGRPALHLLAAPDYADEGLTRKTAPVPDRLSPGEWSTLLSDERDTFKLTIRAWAAIEAEIDASSEALFRVPMDGGMRSLGPITKRISVASALGVVPDVIAPALRALQKLRNDFAHGDIHELDDLRADALLQKLRETDVLTGDLERLVEGESPLNKLRGVLLIVMGFVQRAGEFVLDMQQQGDRAVALRRVLDRRRESLVEQLGAEQTSDEQEQRTE
jgi:hypothetical protein